MPGSAAQYAPKIVSKRDLHHLTAAVFTIALAFCGCGRSAERAESARLIQVVDELRLAPNAAKHQALERLHQVACSHQLVCEAKQACADAYSHHVRGLAIGQHIREALDSEPDRAAAAGFDLGLRLQQMDHEIEQGRVSMPLCDERVARLRIRHKL